MKLGLGTVQFGLDYGISNPDGRTTLEEASEILEVARNCRISIIDTAALYGSSEEVLGRILPEDHDFKLITKTIRIDACRITPADASMLEKTFTDSLYKLRCHSIYGLMIHSADDLLAEGGSLLFECMTFLKEQGLIQKIGVSVYTSEQVDQVLQQFAIDLIQLPVNVLDQRLLQGKQLFNLKAAGVEIHARSAFLQGLLLMDPGELPRHFDPVRKHLLRYHEYLNECGLTPMQAALGFVTALDEIDVVICGVNNHQQLKELCAASARHTPIDLRQFALDDEMILNPSKWSMNS